MYMMTAAGLTDKGFKYYTSLACLLHVWRDNARAMHDCFKRRFPKSSGCRKSLKVPPMPLVGRWGRKSECESYVCSFDAAELIEASLGTGYPKLPTIQVSIHSWPGL